MSTETEVVNFTNVDAEDFEGQWGGEKEVIKAGVTKPLPRFLAEHYAKHLVNKILIGQQKDFGDEGLRKPYLDRIIIGISETVPAAQEEAVAESAFEEKPKEEVATETPKEKIEGVKCDICGKVVKNEFALRMHRGRFHPVKK